MSKAEAITLAQWAPRCLIVAHRENTEQLGEALRSEGFEVQVVRVDYSSEQTCWSPSRKCLLTHRAAWRRAVEAGRPWLVVEADFVPCVGMGVLPVPLRVAPGQLRLIYLYACGPTLYRVLEKNWAEGDAGGCVALGGEPKVAQHLLDLTAGCLQELNLQDYSLWDAKISASMRRRLGVRTLIPIRNLGEHGGQPNPEHRVRGLHPTHRADRLAARLHFLPLYTDGHLARYRWVRLRYWIHGCGRLAFGRLVRWRTLLRVRNHLAWFVWRRLVGWRSELSSGSSVKR